MKTCSSNIMIIPILVFYSSFLTIATSSSIYDIMRSNGLPEGLFPIGITNLTIATADGSFTATLNESCDANFEESNNLVVHYHRNISGTIARGSISNISGVSAKDLFVWFQLNSILVDSGVVHFDVGGVVRKQLSVSLFETPRTCTPSEADPPTVTNHLSSRLNPPQQVGKFGSEREGHPTVLSSAY